MEMGPYDIQHKPVYCIFRIITTNEENEQAKVSSEKQVKRISEKHTKECCKVTWFRFDNDEILFEFVQGLSLSSSLRPPLCMHVHILNSLSALILCTFVGT